MPMSGTEERIQSALEALMQDETGVDRTIADLTRYVFGDDLSDDSVDNLVASITVLAEVHIRTSGAHAANFLVFLAGAQLGKQLGIGEGAKLPSLWVPNA